MGKNGYLERQKITTNAYRVAERETYVQFMADLMAIVLNNLEVMGKDTFGRERIKKVVAALEEAFDTYADALTTSVEADYWQEKMDQVLRKIFGDDFEPFSKRYRWIKIKGYRPKKK